MTHDHEHPGATLPWVPALIVIAGIGAGCRGEVLLHEPNYEEPQSTCGNGVVDWREVCDGDDLGGSSCAGLGQGDGVLACTATCTRFDLSGCTGPQPRCGNDVRDGAETCDGADVGTATCGDFGWAGGVLGCVADCSDFDQSGCTAAPCPDLLLGSGLGTLSTGNTPGSGDDLAGSCGGAGGPDVAMGWVAPAAGVYRFDTIGSSFDTVLAVLDGDCAGSELGCNDDGDGAQSLLEVALAAGQSVVVVVDGNGTAAGDYVLSITSAGCGDGVASSAEVCDGNDLRGASCEDLGLRSGELHCDGDCLDFDATACLDPGVGDCCTATPGIGNCSDPLIAACVCAVDSFCCGGQWDDGCVAQVQPLGCGDCGFGPVCGDGVAAGDEVCDGADVGGVACADLGFASGSLACDPSCLAFDTSGCTGPSICCAATPGLAGCPDLVVQDCVCQNDVFCCQSEWDGLCVEEIESYGCGVCNGQGVCGNGVAEGFEICDGADLRGAQCVDLGFIGGPLGCSGDCGSFDVAGCVGPVTCGNGIAEGNEFCDGSDLRGLICADFGFGAGGLGCAPGCFGFDTSGCFNIDTCGDGVIQANEACDGANLGDVNCSSLGFVGGTLACLPDCSAFDTSGCTTSQQGNCCTATSVPGCTAATIEQCVCAADVFCCNVSWDDVCVGEVASQGCGICAASCGNDTIEPPEVCDGMDLGGLGCGDFGYPGGMLACAADCSLFDLSLCDNGSVCGDGIATPPAEMCDGPDLLGASCASLGLGNGALGCAADCTYDLSGCGGGAVCCAPTPGSPGCGDPVVESCVCAQDGFCCQVEWDDLCAQEVDQFGCGSCGAQSCGNGVAEGAETCDGADLRGLGCTDFGFSGGVLACSVDCTGYDTSGCLNVATCGDGVAAGTELCDGADLRGLDCSIFGFTGGTLGCAAGCSAFDTSGCTGGTAVCGNGVAENMELCDGADLRFISCQLLGYGGGGVLVCDPGCYGFDTSGCIGGGPVCGNNIAEGMELCDGTDVRGLTCQLLGYGTGALECDPGCGTFDTMGCSGGGVVCGDGVAGGMEMCDGPDLRGMSCQFLGFTGGALACDGSCNYDTSGCIDNPQFCGNGIAEGTEQCDGFDLRGMICTDLGLPGGNLGCTPFCSFETVGCVAASTCPDIDLGSAVGPVATGSTVGRQDQRGGTCVGVGAPDVTFLWQAPYAAIWEFTTVGSTYDTGLYLLGGGCTGPELACNDDVPGGGLQSRITIDLTAGQVIVVVVDGWANSSGNYSLTIAEAIPVCGDGIIESPEVCDGGNLGGTTCQSLGFSSGLLACQLGCLDFDPSGCGNSTSDCCTANSAPGCSDADIQACVCASDSFCCQTRWDDVCVSEVTQLGCGSCTGRRGNCCVATPGVSGCNDATIEGCVCAADTYCCSQEWDGRCVRHVGSYGCGTCTTP